MKWAEIKGTHINTNQIQTFYWKDGQLWVWLAGDFDVVPWDDPDRKLYKRLCQSQGISPCEEENHG